MDPLWSWFDFDLDYNSIKFLSSFKVLTNKSFQFHSYSISIIELLLDSLSFRL